MTFWNKKSRHISVTATKTNHNMAKIRILFLHRLLLLGPAAAAVARVLAFLLILGGVLAFVIMMVMSVKGIGRADDKV